MLPGVAKLVVQKRERRTGRKRERRDPGQAGGQGAHREAAQGRGRSVEAVTPHAFIAKWRSRRWRRRCGSGVTSRRQWLTSSTGSSSACSADVGLLPDHMFTRLLCHAHPASGAVPGAHRRALPGDGLRRPCRLRGGGVVQRRAVRRRRGAAAREVRHRDGARGVGPRLGWRSTRRSSGRCSERGRDRGKRAQLGAHYTDRRRSVNGHQKPRQSEQMVDHNILGVWSGASSDKGKSGRRARSRRQGREPRESGGGAQRRALTPASTRGTCRSDDAPATTTSCGRHESRIRRFLAVANKDPAARRAGRGPAAARRVGTGDGGARSRAGTRGSRPVARCADETAQRRRSATPGVPAASNARSPEVSPANVKGIDGQPRGPPASSPATGGPPAIGGRGQARPFSAADLGGRARHLPPSPYPRGRGLEFDAVAAERGWLRRGDRRAALHDRPRRREVAALRCIDVADTADGVWSPLRGSKTNQEGDVKDVRFVKDRRVREPRVSPR